MPHVGSFQPDSGSGGFLSPRAGNKVRGISAWNDMTTRLGRRRSGLAVTIGLQGMDGVKAFTGAAAAVLFLALADPAPAQFKFMLICCKDATAMCVLRATRL